MPPTRASGTPRFAVAARSRPGTPRRSRSPNDVHPKVTHSGKVAQCRQSPQPPRAGHSPRPEPGPVFRKHPVHVVSRAQRHPVGDPSPLDLDSSCAQRFSCSADASGSERLLPPCQPCAGGIASGHGSDSVHRPGQQTTGARVPRRERFLQELGFRRNAASGGRSAATGPGGHPLRLRGLRRL